MSRETLEDDLRTQCHNKLLQWVNDTVELYRMADFGAVEIFMTLITLLVWELSRVIRTTMRNAPHLDALNHTLAQPEALRTTAQCIFDLRFHDLIELCQKAIGNSDKLASIQPFDLATGLSGWAIEQLAKKHE